MFDSLVLSKTWKQKESILVLSDLWVGRQGIKGGE